MRKDYDIVGSYNQQRFASINSERTVNLFEYIDPSSKRPKTLIPTSGLVNTNVDFVPVVGGFRAQFVFKNRMYISVGDGLFSLSVDLSKDFLGDIGTSFGYVGVDANTFQVIFVDGIKGYIYDTNISALIEITDPGFPGRPIDVTALDGFFVVANGETNEFRLSELNNGLIWSELTDTFTADAATDEITIASALNYALTTPVTVSNSGGALPAGLDAATTYYAVPVSSTVIKLALSPADAVAAQTDPSKAVDITSAGTGTQTITNNGQLQQGTITSHPGNIVACRTLHRRLFLFSNNYTEMWVNAGAGTILPFRRDNSVLIEYGTPSRGSISVGFDTMFFLSQDKDGLGSVMQVNGTQANAVSTRAIDFDLAQFAAADIHGVDDARGILIKENGLIFYRLNFTRSNQTFVYNVSMSDPQNLRWHEEQVLNGDRHPAQTHAFFNGNNYYGDYSQDILYRVDSTISTNAGESIKRLRIGKPITPEGLVRIRIDRFHLDLVQGDVDDEIVDTEFLEAENSDDLFTETEQLILTEQEFVINDGTPQVFLSISRDGGQTFGNLIRAPMGKIGERSARTVWRKLGTIPRGQAFVPKIQFYNRTPFVILGAAWDFEVLPE